MCSHRVLLHLWLFAVWIWIDPLDYCLLLVCHTVSGNLGLSMSFPRCAYSCSWTVRQSHRTCVVQHTHKYCKCCAMWWSANLSFKAVRLSAKIRSHMRHDPLYTIRQKLQTSCTDWNNICMIAQYACLTFFFATVKPPIVLAIKSKVIAQLLSSSTYTSAKKNHRLS
jgi:hypothetical protein